MPGSRFDDVLLINPTRIQPATSDEVASAESELGVRMPSGYADYVERLGEGALGHFVRVHLPGKLPELTRDWRERIQEYWFWDTADAGAAPESLQERGVVLADTFDGDELCFDPVDPDSLFVLPRDEETAHRAGPGFLAAVEWMLSGMLNPWVEGWTFEAWTHRAEVRRRLGSDDGLAVVEKRVEKLGTHSHVVDLGPRKTFFLPAISGRLSLYQFDGQDLSLDLTYDEDADLEAINRIVSALG
jgi:hypothetical protein